MNNPKEINVLATWLPIKSDELSIKAFGSGYPYTQNRIILRSDLYNRVIRYAKNYTNHNKKFSLCIITTENDTKKMEDWLDKQAKQIKAKDIVDGFKVLDVKFQAQPTQAQRVKPNPVKTYRKGL